MFFLSWNCIFRIIIVSWEVHVTNFVKSLQEIRYTLLHAYGNENESSNINCNPKDFQKTFNKIIIIKHNNVKNVLGDPVWFPFFFKSSNKNTSKTTRIASGRWKLLLSTLQKKNVVSNIYRVFQNNAFI